jgi:A/G-specific adenine glycosylase
MLGAMRALPDDGWSARADGSGLAPLPGPWRRAGEVIHVFTHCRLTLELAIYSGNEWASLPASGEWWPLEQLAAAGLPSLYAKAAALTDREGENRRA